MPRTLLATPALVPVMFAVPLAAQDVALENPGFEQAAENDPTMPDGQPAVLENHFGDGRCFLITPRHFPMGFGGSHGTRGLYRYYWPGVRELLAGLTWAALEAADGSQPVLAENCPVDAELALRRQGDRLIVHLLNYHDEGPVSGVRLHVPTRESKRVFYATNPDALLKCPPAPDGFTIPVRDFDHHVMLVIEPG